MTEKMITKIDAEINPFFGKKPNERDIQELLENGIVVIDKPSGPTSHQVASWVKDILHIGKTGHGGTLDPKVTGVLPVSLQNATKAIGLMHEARKEYVCIMRFNNAVDKKKLKETMRGFIGLIWQVPPKEAAVKRVKRQRRIFYINVLESDGKKVLFKVGCEGGTYIRVLCEDIGKKLGTRTYMEELRRTKSGVFNERDLTTLQELLDAYIFWKEDGNENLKQLVHPIEDMLIYLPSIIIKDSAVGALCYGADLASPGIAKVETGIKRGNTICIKTLKGEAVAVAEALMDTHQMLESEKGIVADTKRVLMKRNVYPPMWKTLR